MLPTVSYCLRNVVLTRCAGGQKNGAKFMSKSNGGKSGSSAHGGKGPGGWPSKVPGVISGTGRTNAPPSPKNNGYLHSRVGIRPFWPWILGQVKCSLWLDCSVFIASPESNIGWILWCNSLALIQLPALCLLQQRRNVRPIFHLAVTCSNTTTDLSGFFGVQRLCPNDGVAITPT